MLSVSLPSKIVSTTSLLPAPATQFSAQLSWERANTVVGPLVALAPTLALLVAPGGWLALSGVLAVGARGAAVCYAYRYFFPDVKVAAETSGWLLITGPGARERALKELRWAASLTSPNRKH
jgi:ribosomal protein L11 methyltransferase